MAKTKTDKTDKPAKTTKVPKSIAGVKLSKPVRKAAEAIIAEVQKPGTKELLASGAAMAVSAIVASKVHRNGAQPNARPATAKPGDPGVTRHDTDQIVDALSSAAKQVMQQVFAKRGV